ncbi:uncharacterized protein LOC102358969 [Latimeria chalumnae]|nr:PREDICTED: uncharacterized protein LOC102358969 isoform X2 [Latimeria chalumnae]XP_005999919.1 PREDICTED: uncharacterized protein LOC102358969 isoform X2 [Latimeria chalumnae]|eukprot:XP_005999918.1 PREDICTED: uncharacterized protein LOC102358969 isoform X2 [Latimeria chalumnae]
MAATRRQKQIFLIGNTNDKITGARLPSSIQVLQVFFHFHSELKLRVRESSTKTIDLVLPFWEKAGIPSRPKQHVIFKLEDLFQRWKNIQKNKSRRSGAQIQKEEEFTKLVQELFDIAHQDALQIMTIQEDKDFLIAQRHGRQGSITSVDEEARRKEIKKQKERERTQERVQKDQAEKRRMEETVELKSSSTSDDEFGTAEEAGGAVGGAGPSHT